MGGPDVQCGRSPPLVLLATPPTHDTRHSTHDNPRAHTTLTPTTPNPLLPQIIKYDKVIDIPNSMTVLPELLPMSIEMAKRKLTGIMNYTNPGAISHNEILQVRQGRGVIRARAPARLLPLFTPSSRPAPLRSFSRTMWTPSSHGPTLRWRSRPR